MGINLQISEALASNLLATWEARLNHINEEVDSLLREQKEIKESIELLKSSMKKRGDVGSAVESDYHKEWTVFRKAIYLLQKYQRPLSTRELVEYILETYEPELKAQRSKLVSALSGVLSTKVKEGKVVRGQNVLGENVFAIPPETARQINFIPSIEQAS